MTEFIVFIAFVVWSLLWSFAWVIIDRRADRSTILTWRSHCDSCRHVLARYDLIPFMSFVSTGWICRYCKITLPRFLWLAEFVYGAIFAIGWYLIWEQIWYIYPIVALIIWTMATLSRYDRVYQEVVVPLVIIQLIIVLLLFPSIPRLGLTSIIGFFGMIYGVWLMIQRYKTSVWQEWLWSWDIIVLVPFAWLWVLWWWSWDMQIFLGPMIGFVSGVVGMIVVWVFRRSQIAFVPALYIWLGLCLVFQKQIAWYLFGISS